MCGVQAITVTPCATAARAIANDTDKFCAPSSTPGSKWQCRSINGRAPQKDYFWKGLKTRVKYGTSMVVQGHVRYRQTKSQRSRNVRAKLSITGRIR
jgi:hypothetical protein